MASFRLHWNVYAASVLSLALIFGAYAFATKSVRTPTAEASTETALLTAIATKDTDGDGLADWEEALYGTDPHKTDTRGLGMTDGEAVAKGLVVPGTGTVAESTSDSDTSREVSLTKLFAQKLFIRYIAKKRGAPQDALTAEDLRTLVEDTFLEFDVLTPHDTFRSDTDIAVGAAGADALRAYAVAADKLLMAHTTHLPRNELEYLTEAVVEDDASATQRMAELAESYRNMAIGLSALPVPPELRHGVVKLVNAIARLGQITADLARIKEDSIRAMLALKQYGRAMASLSEASVEISRTYLDAGIFMKSTEPGAIFVRTGGASSPKLEQASLRS